MSTPTAEYQPQILSPSIPWENLQHKESIIKFKDFDSLIVIATEK